MADNISITPGAGATVGADNISNVFYQVVKVAYGLDGAMTRVDTTAPLPVFTTSTNSSVTVGAADFTTDQTAVADSDQIVYNRTKYSVSQAIATVTSGQTNSIVVSAVASHKIVVINFWVMAQTAATNVTFKTYNGTTGTAISPIIPANANGGIAPGREPAGWFRTNTGDSLAVDTSASSSSTSMIIMYIAV